MVLPTAALAVALALILSLTFGTGAAGLRLTALDGWGFDLVRATLSVHPGIGRALRPFLDHNILKMGPPVLALVGLWAVCLAERDATRQEFVARSLFGLVLALAIGRGMQHLLPARPRPLAALPDFPFPGQGSEGTFLASWSSLPSDHAVLAFGLAAVVWAWRRPLGGAVFLWSALLVCFPRLLFGFHYLSDLVSGGLLGAAVTAMVLRAPLPARAMDRVMRLAAGHPGLTGAALFLFAHEAVDTFYDLSWTLRAARSLLRAVLGGG